MVTPVLYDYTDCKRGCLGRTPDVMTLDLSLSYDWKIKDTTLNLGLTVFNIFDDQTVLNYRDWVESTAGIPDPDFGQVSNDNLFLSDYQRPRSYRFSARWMF